MSDSKAKINEKSGRISGITAVVASESGSIYRTAPDAAVSATVNLTVNGKAYSLQVEPNWPLRDVLREKLGLTSIKDFCNGYGAVVPARSS
jgi:hypothetical protein